MGSVTITGLGKAYRHYSHPSGRLLEWLGAGSRHELKWILRNINLKVVAGESVGLIGRNGAGKSTLLKLITGVSVPTEGSALLTGRVASLLELGLGFHQEFTGRQNVYMQGYLQGFNRDQIDSLIPNIIDFAEIGDYFDRPVRIYSSGMQVRLAFSIATAVSPDILIIDEALAVGDAYFQHKCFNRIRSYREQGTTLLFVSHDPGAVKTLCDRAVLIDGGGIIMDSNPADVLDYYNALIARYEVDSAIREGAPDGSGTRSGNGAVHIVSADLLSEGESMRAIIAGESARIHLRLQAREPQEDFTIGLLIKDRLGNDVFGTNTHHMHQALGPIASGEIKDLFFDFPSLALGSGHYSVTLAAHASSDHLAGNYDWWERALVFQVMPAKGPHTIGLCHMPLTCHQQAVHVATQ
jgi:lipopolysaccharide transport system ATP-binding protein